jgi:hypothetical protein
MTEPQPKAEDDSELSRVLQRFQKTVTQGQGSQAAEGRTEPQPSAPAKVIQLPLWPEPVRGTPNSFLRSALFAAIQGKTRRWMKAEFLGSLQGISVRFTGQQLDQSDLDVWEQAVHLTRLHPLGNTCQFTGYAFLKALARSTGNTDYKWLHSTITRLIACAVEIRSGPKVFTGSLLSSCTRNEGTDLYKLTLDPKTLKLYGWNDWTAIDWEQRQALRRKPLALWLHGFYSSHAAPFPVKIETLRQLSGSATKRLRKFEENLRKALDDLETATGIKGTIDDDDDLVTVERLPSRTQQRHLTRKSKQRRAIRKPRQKHQNWQRLGDF